MLTRLSIHFAEIRQGVIDNGVWWGVRFFLVYLGNPVIFLLFIVTVFELAPDSSLLSKKVSTNVTWLNPLTYILVTLPLYMGWIVGSMGVCSNILGGSCCFGNFDAEKSSHGMFSRSHHRIHTRTSELVYMVHIRNGVQCFCFPICDCRYSQFCHVDYCLCIFVYETR